ncbi:MAG: hypothetical protein C4529_09590 [Deltaproteobacteria bacterium]|nr:MAG: hypothetical protein C4529_09590 [Deltaproteobacteria bacterium]
MKMKFFKVLTAVTLAAAGFLQIPAPVSAARLDVTPSISLDQLYDSNVFNTDRNEKEDFILRTTPMVTFSVRMPETTLSMHSSLTVDSYYKYTERNNKSSSVSLGIDATPIQVSPRFSFLPSGHYVQSSDSFQRTQLVPSGDPLITPSIASETATRKSRDYGAALRMSYMLTPTIDFSIGGGFSKRQFLDNTAGDFDSRVVSGETAVTYKFTPLFSSGFFLNTAHNTFENGRDSRTVAGGVTGTYLISPVLSLTARAGASRAKETRPVAGIPDRTTTSPSGSLSAIYKGENIKASLGGSIAQTGGGSFGLTTRRQSVGFSLTDRLAREWTVDLAGTIQENRSLDAAVSEDIITATGTAGVRYQLLSWTTIRFSGTAFRQWSNASIGTDLKRYSAFLGITIGYMYNIY